MKALQVIGKVLFSLLVAVVALVTIAGMWVKRTHCWRDDCERQRERDADEFYERLRREREARHAKDETPRSDA